MNSDQFDNEHDPLEQGLRQFAPRPSSLDRDRLMFLAGQQFAIASTQSVSGSSTHKRSAWLWPAATLSMTTVAACFAIAFVWQVSRPAEVRIVVREVPVVKPAPTQMATISSELMSTPTQPITTAPISLSLPASSVLQMRNVALRFGVEAIPAEQRSYTSSTVQLSPIDRWQQLRDAAPESDSSL